MPELPLQMTKEPPYTRKRSVSNAKRRATLAGIVQTDPAKSKAARPRRKVQWERSLRPKTLKSNELQPKNW